MNIVSRATNIITQPRPEWGRIEAEPGTAQSVFLGYAPILAALPAVAGLLAGAIYSPFGILGALITAALGYALGLGLLYLMGIIANALAPSFGGVKNDAQAMKLVVYSATPIWLMGVVTGLLNIIPILGWILGILLGLAAFGYAAYLMYLGSMATTRVPQNQAIVYTLILIVIWFVLYMIVAMIVGAIVVGLLGAAVVAGGMQGFR